MFNTMINRMKNVLFNDFQAVKIKVLKNGLVHIYFRLIYVIKP